MIWERDDPAKHAFVFHTPIMMRRTAVENLAYPLKLSGMAKDQIDTAVDHWLERIGLEASRNRQATHLSGGERQKLAIARALIRNPGVLFLDEPCANLDGHATREIEALLREVASAGTRIVMATHDIGQARRLANDLVFLLAGKIHETGAADTIFDTPDTAELAVFFRGDIVT